MADKYAIPFTETSAKEGLNVNKVFEELGRAIITYLDSLPKEETAGGKFESHKLRVGTGIGGLGCGC
jgi:hypothetical protein